MVIKPAANNPFTNLITQEGQNVNKHSTYTKTERHKDTSDSS